MESSVKKAILVLALASALASCTVSKDSVTLALEGQGYTDITMGGPALFGCSDGDRFTRTWAATGVNGVRVKGVACSGFFKGVTIRSTGRA